MLPEDLPADLPGFVARFGSDEQCHDHLFRQRWPDGFACRACGHQRAWRLRRRRHLQCAVCGQQRSLLKGTVFEQTKTGLACWFLSIHLVSSSKGGISAMELQRQLGLGRYQTAWTWLHKLRRAMVRPGREPLSEQVEADETYVGGSEPGKRGRGAGGKTVVAGAVESGRGKRRGRRLGRLRLAALPDVSRASLEGFLAAHLARPAAVTTDGWTGLAVSARRAGSTRPSPSAPAGAMRRCACRPSTWCSASPSAGCSAVCGPSTCRPISTSSSSLQPPHRQEHQPPLRPPGRARGADPAQHLPRPGGNASLTVMASQLTSS